MTTAADAMVEAMTVGISETSAEKPKRGRPRKLHPAMESLIRTTSPGKSDRAIQDFGCAVRALRVLGLRAGEAPEIKAAHDRYGWLQQQRGPGQPRDVFRQSILTELGRIEDEDALRSVADQICEDKPKARAAVQRIRRWRVDAKPAAAEQLRNELIRVIDDYRHRHPDTDYYLVRDALDQATDISESLLLPKFTGRISADVSEMEAAIA